MTIAVPDLTVLPPAEPLDELVDMLRRLDSDRPAELVGPDGVRLRLPTPVYEVLREVVQAMARGQAVTIAPHNQRLTTQEAADLLGVSRPTLVKMLDDGLIPFEQPGRHRRVLLRDVLAFQEARRSAREAALDELIEASEEADGYRNTTGPKRTR
ncbi:helix-turn-helix domain-containing protein [Hamadaea sp. NPDC051192]|uniref:helix-turn-helix domain-containing protein n=1 Tax=Hamadaea sp. NPDC051192 TaxID=3154940 RepID=UPI00342276AD